MNLVRFENFEVVVEPEALLLKPFAKLWERDNSPTKLKVLQEFAFMYFYLDPRSDYSYIVDEKSRFDEVAKQTGFRKNWTPDKRLLEAMELYKKLTQTTTSITLETIRIAADTLNTKLKTINLDEVDENNKPKYPIEKYVATLDKLLVIMPKIKKTEEEMKKDTIENARLRGQAEKKLGEDGF